MAYVSINPIMASTPSQIFHSKSQHDTETLAAAFAAALLGGTYVSLEGDLGAGKTFFARHLARILGVTDPITSPTFVIQKTYPLARPGHVISQLAHYDLYRLTDYHELIDLGFEDHDDQTLVLIEWGNMFLSDLPPQTTRVIFNTTGADSREITFLNAPPIELPRLNCH